MQKYNKPLKITNFSLSDPNGFVITNKVDNKTPLCYTLYSFSTLCKRPGFNATFLNSHTSLTTVDLLREVLGELLLHFSQFAVHGEGLDVQVGLVQGLFPPASHRSLKPRTKRYTTAQRALCTTSLLTDWQFNIYFNSQGHSDNPMFI